MTIMGVVSQELGDGVALAVHEGTDYEGLNGGVAGSWFRACPGQA
jgi:hypothetical protein